MYERADGTVETALNAEDAIARCPVLGKMPVEQASVLLELAAVGKEKMAAQAKQAEMLNRAKQKPEPELTEISKKTQKESSTATEDPISSPTATSAERDINTAAMDEQVRLHQLVTDQREELLRRQAEEQPGQPVIKDVPPPEKAVTNNQTAESALDAEPGNSADRLPGPSSVQSDMAEIPAENQMAAISEAQVPEFKKPTVEAMAGTIDAAVTAGTLPETGETDVSDMPSAPEIMPPAIEPRAVDASEYEEVIFDEEVIDTFEQLTALIDVEQAEVTLAVSELYAMSTEDEINLLSQELAAAIQANKINVFEEFVMAQDPPEAGTDIEAVVAAAANDRPLEETLVQLSLYLRAAAETADDVSPDTVAGAIREALSDLAEILPPAGTSADQAERPAITPEMTQKLLILLRAAGYDNPREALVGFVERNDFEFLMQAIRYLYQLSDSTSRQEFLSSNPSIFMPVSTDEPFTTRLGRAIMRRFFPQDTAILPA